MPIGLILGLGRHVDVDVAAAWGMRLNAVPINAQSDKTRVKSASRRSAVVWYACAIHHIRSKEAEVFLFPRSRVVLYPCQQNQTRLASTSEDAPSSFPESQFAGNSTPPPGDEIDVHQSTTSHNLHLHINTKSVSLSLQPVEK